MYAIAFDMTVADLKEHYGNPSSAYTEIKDVLYRCGFEWIQGSTYLTKCNDLTAVYVAIHTLASIPWFKKSVRDVRAFRVEDWSDFTQVVKS
jgi:virulence-associated protein VapD